MAHSAPEGPARGPRSAAPRECRSAHAGRPLAEHRVACSAKAFLGNPLKNKGSLPGSGTGPRQIGQQRRPALELSNQRNRAKRAAGGKKQSPEEAAMSQGADGAKSWRRTASRSKREPSATSTSKTLRQTLHETFNDHTTWVIKTHTAWKARTHFFFQLFFEKGQFFLENCPRVSVSFTLVWHIFF